GRGVAWGRSLALGLPARVGLLVAGLFCFALGVVLNLQSNTGLAPWNAFHFGIHLQTGITLGEASVGVGLALIGGSWLMGVGAVRAAIEGMVLVAGWALGGPIGVGTLVFVFGIGPAIQLAFRLFRIQSERPTAQPAVQSGAPS